MNLFHRAQDDDAAPTATPIAVTLAHLEPLSVPLRAAELLANITASLDADAAAMDQILAPWLPEGDWMALSPAQRTDWLALALILREAFGALVLARLLVRQEQTYQGATWITYVNSPDGRAALTRGDVADVVARRLPE